MTHRTINLSRGLVALVDDSDYDLLSAIKWHAQPTQKRVVGFYAVNGRGGSKPTIHGRRYMHRMIVGAAAEQLVDHINGNGLDNRRCNLRIATRAQNGINREWHNSFGFRGVSCNRPGRFRAILRVNGKRHSSGYFSSPVDAAKAYDLLAVEHHGAFAMLNFPQEFASQIDPSTRKAGAA